MCIFCKIVQGEIPCYKIYEDENNIAFLDISPRTKGHSLVIPKKHSDTLDSISQGDYIALSLAVTKVAHLLKSKLSADGYNIFCNNGTVAGQEVPHTHFHIFPRFADNKIKMTLPPILEDIKKNLSEIHKQIIS